MAATYCNYHAIENVNVISGNNLCARPAQCDIGYKINRAVAARRIKFQGRVCRKQTVADSEHAVVAECRDFDEITMGINGVARARSSQVNLAGIASVADVNRYPISEKSYIYSGAACVAVSYNGKFANGVRRI